jgi:hypothetical protein
MENTSEINKLEKLYPFMNIPKPSLSVCYEE